MTPTAPQYGSDSELQADVMRFMAIIAFCLIAILALVRNVAPAAEPETPASPTAKETEVPAPVEPEPPEAVPTPAPEPVRTPEPVAAIPVAAVPPPPVRAVPAEPRSAAAEPARPAPPAPAARTPDAPTAPKAPQKPAAAPASEPADQEGLILRFASDGDFLRLIARGDIQVYAYQERDVLTLGGNYQFMETRAPGQVYELLRGSIPTLVMDALKRSRTDVEGYRWGVVLPGRISHQIESYLGQVKSGQLVIDRFGDVHHVAAS